MNDKAIRGILIPYGIVITEGQVVHKGIQFLESVPDVLWIRLVGIGGTVPKSLSPELNGWDSEETFCLCAMLSTAAPPGSAELLRELVYRAGSSP